MIKRKVILDCDTKNEIDDQFAIVHALRSPQLELLGVVSVQNHGAHGDASVDIYHAEARRVLRLADSTVPAFKGSRFALDTTQQPVKSTGVDFIIESARRLGKELSIVGTGPATNLAAACMLEPKIMKCPQIIWIGGFRDNKEMRAVKGAECNFVNDRSAVATLCATDIDLTLVPAMGVTDRMIIQVRYLSEQLKARGTPLTRYLARLLDSVPDRHRIFWDTAAVAVAEGLGVDRVVRKPACVVKDNMLTYPQQSSRTIKVVDSIDEFEILAETRKRLLS
ncbi:MAG: nucleoside hydrolase [Verrucomicrobiota bacterium]|nr:nucleoside hydrolase [Verrucomicrobiota bacterium]